MGQVNLFTYILFISLFFQACGKVSNRIMIDSDLGNNNVWAMDDLNYYLGDLALTIVIKKKSFDGMTGQDFYLEKISNHIIIYYTSENSLNNAVYTLLHKLGMRWYGPHKVWTYIPKDLKNIDIPGKWNKPIYRNRYFFGTGGMDFESNLSTDPTNQCKNDWLKWKNRNKFNYDIKDNGHVGGLYYFENKSFLDTKDNWFSSDLGKKSGRIRVENDLALDHYVNWLISRSKHADEQFRVIGVDPEDGRGDINDPLPINHPIIKNYSDKWWLIANKVATKVKEDGNTIITMYSYGDGEENAKTPSFPLERNVYPIIVPYAFQRAYLPEEMIKEWSEKVNGAMGIYDYWNISQWSIGLPQMNIHSIDKKLNLWKTKKIDGVYIETTEGAGASGCFLWVAGQMMFNKVENFKLLYQEYLDNCFGEGADEIKKMFDRWSINYQYAGEIYHSMENLSKAIKKVKRNSSEYERITHLMAYVIYLKKYYEHDKTLKSKKDILEYLVKIHHTYQVQTASIITQDYISPPGKLKLNSNLSSYTTEEITTLFNNEFEKVKNKRYNISNCNSNQESIKFTKPIENNVWRFGSNSSTFEFYSGRDSIFRFDFGTEKLAKFICYYDPQNPQKFDVSNQNYDYLESIDRRKWYMKSIEIKTPRNQIITLKLSGMSHRLLPKNNIVLLKNPGKEDFDNYQYPKHYFYMPSDVEELVFKDLYPENTNGRGYFYDSEGKKYSRVKIFGTDVYKIKFNKLQAGKLWCADFGHPNWQFLNIPNIAALQSFEVKEMK